MLKYNPTLVDRMPPRRNTFSGRWTWLRDYIINDLVPDGKPARFTVPNKRESEAMRSAAQNCASVPEQTRAKKLPWPLKVTTATEPVDGKNGKYYVFIGVYTP